jgi:hypothetical protein
MRAPWDEQELYSGIRDELFSDNPQLDERADSWLARRVFKESIYGVGRGVAVSGVLEVRRNLRARSAKRANT